MSVAVAEGASAEWSEEFIARPRALMSNASRLFVIAVPDGGTARALLTER